MSTEIIGLSHLEREIVANVVRYNIRDFDYNMVRMEAGPELSSGSLPDQSDATILTAKLTAMLRLANSMDRSHGQKLKDCRITVKDKTLTVSAEYSGILPWRRFPLNRRRLSLKRSLGSARC